VIYSYVTATVRCDNDGCKAAIAVKGREGEYDHTVKLRTQEHARKHGWVRTDRWFCADCARHLKPA
jgi:hypothetical protein